VLLNQNRTFAKVGTCSDGIQWPETGIKGSKDTRGGRVLLPGFSPLMLFDIQVRNMGFGTQPHLNT
jgi:hypothetical protein